MKGNPMIIIGVVVLVVVLFDSFIAPLLLSALIVEAIVINPLLYMAFGQPYNNYKTFIKA